MATRADFYILHPNGQMELLGCTSNEYSGDFEDAKNETQYRKGVSELLQANRSLPGKWYWPWLNSHITDEVFVFEITPTLFNKHKGRVLTKVYTKPDVPETKLAFIENSKRGDDRYTDQQGYTRLDYCKIIELPTFERA